MAAESTFLQARAGDPQVEADLDELKRARAQDEQARVLKRAGLAAAQEDAQVGASISTDAGERMGRDLLIATYDALKETAETALDATQMEGVPRSDSKDLKAKATPDVDLRDIMPEFMEAADAWREEIGRDSKIEDVILQKLGQFTLPFMAAMKATGVAKTASATAKAGAAVAAGALTDFSVWNPHEGRFADLLAEFAPDNALLAPYIDYLASDEEDSDAEGRWKNAIDGVVVGGIAGTMLYAGGKALKFGIDQTGRAMRTAGAERKARRALDNIEYDESLPVTQAGIEREFGERMRADIDQLRLEYARHPETAGGRVLSADVAKELEPLYVKDRSLSPAVHEPASAFIKAEYARALARDPLPGQQNVVLFTAGGTGAGKTSGLRRTLPQLEAEAQIIYDTNMAKYGSSKAKVEQALKAGKKVTIAFTYRNPLEAFDEGVLRRATAQEGEFGSGRTLRPKTHFETHRDSIATVRRLAKDYVNDDRVEFIGIDNSLGSGKARLVDIADLPVHSNSEYNAFGEQALEIAKQRLAEGRISERTFRSIFGEAPLQDRVDLGEGLERSGAAGAGRQASPAALTRRGKADKDPLAPLFDTPLGRGLAGRLVPRDQGGASRVFRRADPGDDRGHVAFEPDPEVDGAVRALGADPPARWIELPPEEAAAGFSAKLKQTFDSGALGKQVTPLTPEELQGHRLFVGEGGKVGFAIAPDGELVGFWKNKGAHRLATVSALKLAVEQGATHLNAFDTALPHLYARMGFKEVARIRFNREFAPKGWNYWKMGTPDIVFMRYDPKAVGSKYTPGSRYVASYDEAMALARGETPKKAVGE